MLDFDFFFNKISIVEIANMEKINMKINIPKYIICFSLFLIFVSYLCFAEDSYQQAMTLFKSGDYQQAQLIFNQFISEYPESSNCKSAEFYSIKCYYMLGKYPEMEQAIQNLKQKNPQHQSLDDLEFLRGIANLKTKNYDTAKSIFIGLKSTYPDSSYSKKISERVTSINFHPIMILYDVLMYDEFIKLSEQFRKDNLNNPYSDDLMFIEMLSLRKLNKWEEARKKANDLIVQYPDSPYSTQMGGTNGRTENQAAIDYAEAVKAYHTKNFEEAGELFSQFLINYPSNWRKEESGNYLCYSLYHSRKSDDFFNKSSEMINQYPKSQYIDDLLYLQSAVYVQEGKGEDARNILNSLETNYSGSNLYNNFRQMRLESYLYEDCINSLSEYQQEWSSVEDLLKECILRTIQLKNKAMFLKNLDLMKDFYKSTNQQGGEKLFYDKLLQQSMPQDWVLDVKKKYILVLANEKFYTEAENLGKELLEDNSLSKEQKQEVSLILTRVYAMQGKLEEAADIYKKYNVSN